MSEIVEIRVGDVVVTKWYDGLFVVNKKWFDYEDTMETKVRLTPIFASLNLDNKYNYGFEFKENEVVKVRFSDSVITNYSTVVTNNDSGTND